LDGVKQKPRLDGRGFRLAVLFVPSIFGIFTRITMEISGANRGDFVPVIGPVGPDLL
jgi:hypothetical protein